MLERTGYSTFLFDRRKDKTGAGADAIQTLAHDIFKQLPGPFAASRVSVQNGYGGGADGPGLQDGTSFPDNRNHRIEFRLGHRERSALDSSHPLPGARKRKIERRGDGHAGRAIDLL